MRNWLWVILCSLLLSLGLACTTEDDDDDTTDTGTDTDTGTGTGDGIIACTPDPPNSCDDFAGMGSDGVLGCCGADGDPYFCEEDIDTDTGTDTEPVYEVGSDDCGTDGCCLGTYDGSPAHVCCT